VTIDQPTASPRPSHPGTPRKLGSAAMLAAAAAARTHHVSSSISSSSHACCCSGPSSWYLSQTAGDRGAVGIKTAGIRWQTATTATHQPAVLDSPHPEIARVVGAVELFLICSAPPHAPRTQTLRPRHNPMDTPTQHGGSPRPSAVRNANQHHSHQTWRARPAQEVAGRPLLLVELLPLPLRRPARRRDEQRPAGAAAFPSSTA
jgi:hypothetical protein